MEGNGREMMIVKVMMMMTMSRYDYDDDDDDDDDDDGEATIASGAWGDVGERSGSAALLPQRNGMKSMEMVIVMMMVMGMGMIVNLKAMAMMMMIVMMMAKMIVLMSMEMVLIVKSMTMMRWRVVLGLCDLSKSSLLAGAGVMTMTNIIANRGKWRQNLKWTWLAGCQRISNK